MKVFRKIKTRPSGLSLVADKLDVVGDVHGCADELENLLRQLGYQKVDGVYRHPDNRGVIFVGDLINRGPNTPGVLKVVSKMVKAGVAMTVLGNHDYEFIRGVGRIEMSARARRTLKALETSKNPEKSVGRIHAVLEDAPLWIKVASRDKGVRGLVAVHGAWHPEFESASFKENKRRCLYGPMGILPDQRRKTRLDWRHRTPKDSPLIVHGHTAYSGPVKVVHNTVCIDTACVFGGHLSAWRWPEQEVVQVPALAQWSKHADLRKKPPLTRLDRELEAEMLDWPSASF